MTEFASSSSLLISSLKEDQQKKIQQLIDRLKQDDNHITTPSEVIGVLRYRDFDVAKAYAQYKSTIGWRSTFPTVSIADVAPFMLCPEGSEGPDGCIFLLEDMKGGCARDKLGRPIIVSIGSLHGSSLEMQKQMVYAFSRAKKYYKEGTIPSHFTVVDIIPPKGALTTFRFPDDGIKSVMDMQRQHYPSTLASTTYMGGVPTMFVWAFKLCRPFMDKESYDNMLIRTDLKDLKKHIDAENSLPAWGAGGSFAFDLPALVSWLAREEQVDPAVQATWTPRRFDPTSYKSDAINDSVLSISSQAMSTFDPSPSKLGVVWKQGSGKGFFANMKWKEKLLCAGLAGHLLFYDDKAVSESNKPKAVIPLALVTVDPVASVKDSAAGRSFGFEVTAPQRNFLFAVGTEEERESWIKAIRAEIKIAILATQQQQQQSQSLGKEQLQGKEEQPKKSKAFSESARTATSDDSDDDDRAVADAMTGLSVKA